MLALGTFLLEVVAQAAQAPEEVAWQLVAAEVGGFGAVVMAVILALYKWLRSAQTRSETAADLDRKELREAAAEDRKMLAGTIGTLSTALHRIELAVVKSDEHNQAAIGGLRADLTRTDRELAAVKDQVSDIDGRVVSLEYGAGGNSVVRRMPKARD